MTHQALIKRLFGEDTQADGRDCVGQVDNYGAYAVCVLCRTKIPMPAPDAPPLQTAREQGRTAPTSPANDMAAELARHWRVP